MEEFDWVEPPPIWTTGEITGRSTESGYFAFECNLHISGLLGKHEKTWSKHQCLIHCILDPFGMYILLLFSYPSFFPWKTRDRQGKGTDEYSECWITHGYHYHSLSIHIYVSRWLTSPPVSEISTLEASRRRTAKGMPVYGCLYFKHESLQDGYDLTWTGRPASQITDTLARLLESLVILVLSHLWVSKARLYWYPTDNSYGGFLK